MGHGLLWYFKVHSLGVCFVYLFICYFCFSGAEELFCFILLLSVRVRWAARPRIEISEATLKQACVGLERKGQKPALYRAEQHMTTFQCYPHPENPLVRVSGDPGRLGFVRLSGEGSGESLEKNVCFFFRSFACVVVEVVMFCKNLGIKCAIFQPLSYIYWGQGICSKPVRF